MIDKKELIFLVGALIFGIFILILAIGIDQYKRTKNTEVKCPPPISHTTSICMLLDNKLYCETPRIN